MCPCDDPHCHVTEYDYVIRDRVPLRLVGSYTRSTRAPSCCGYFAAMALKMLYEHGSAGIEGRLASRLDTYTAREDFLEQTGTIQRSDRILTHRHRHPLQMPNAVAFLSFLGLPHYRMNAVPRPLGPICQEITAYMVAHPVARLLGTYRFGLMVAHILSGGNAHWFSILGAGGPRGEGPFLVYDSCGAGGYFDSVRWIGSQRMREFYGAFPRTSIISALGLHH